MRKIFLTTLIAVYSLGYATASTQFKIRARVGFAKLPTCSNIPVSAYITNANAIQIFDLLKQSGIEFGYSYGGCEDRAHALSMLLSRQGVQHLKIWNFAPHYISLFNPVQDLRIKDKTGVKDSISWGFHVAPAVIVKDGNKVDTLVIDPAIANAPVSYSEWLQLQNCPESYYTFLDPEFFTFYTINGLNYNSNNTVTAIPPGFPSLITGDFRTYIDQNDFDRAQMRMEEGLTVNELGMAMIQEQIKGQADKNKKDAFSKLVTDIWSLTAVLQGGQLPNYLLPYQSTITKYQQTYKQRIDYWNKQLIKN